MTFLSICPALCSTKWHCIGWQWSRVKIYSGNHDDIMKWVHFPRYWPFVQGIHLFPVKSPPKGQWRGALMLSLICVRINGWVNNREAGDLRRYRAHYDVIVMGLSTAVRQQAITWTNVDSDLCRHIALHGQNESKGFNLYLSRTHFLSETDIANVGHVQCS